MIRVTSEVNVKLVAFDQKFTDLVNAMQSAWETGGDDGQSKLDDAISAYRRAISLNPDHANAHSNLGVLLRGAGKPVEAENAYRTAIRMEWREKPGCSKKPGL